MKTTAKYTTGRHGYWNREVSRRKVRIVRLVDKKQRMDQKLTQPTAKDLEASLKKVLLGSGQDDRIGKGGAEEGEGSGIDVELLVVVVISIAVVSIAVAVLRSGGEVLMASTAITTSGSSTLTQFSDGNLHM